MHINKRLSVIFFANSYYKWKRNDIHRGAFMPKIKFPVITLVFLITTFFDSSGESLATILAAIIHEIGHISVMLIQGIGLHDVTVTPYGLEINKKRDYRSFLEEITVSLSGCAVNFLTALFFWRTGGFLFLLASASLTLGILNLLPVLCLDGGTALNATLSLFCLPDTAERICKRVSFVTLIAMWIPAAYIFMYSGCNYSLFIMCVWLFGKIFCGAR